MVLGKLNQGKTKGEGLSTAGVVGWSDGAG